MGARRYEFYLPMLKRPLTSERSVFKILISACPCNITFNIQSFFEGVTMVTIFSHVKITCYFHMWRYEFFEGEKYRYFIDNYILKELVPRLISIQHIKKYHLIYPTRHHMRVELVVDSLPYFEGFSPVFLPPQKINISKFQFDHGRGPQVY
jgi:hypothetical protein